MITTCTVCQARYQLDDEKIPARVIKVRCPACSGVFTLDGTQASREELLVTNGFDATPPAPQPPAPPVPAPPPPPAPEVSPIAAAPAPMVSTPEAAPAIAAAVTPDIAPAAAVTPEPAAIGVAVMDEPAPVETPRKPRRRRGKEEMLARALVSDIMVYNREMYDTAKAEGNLLEAMGPEIKKSWDLYKEKVTPEVANSTDHFRDALNEILADGEKVF